MTNIHGLLFPLVAATLLSACGEQAIPYPDASRVDSNALMFFNDPINEGSVTDQVAALNASADQLVRETTVTGALVGAAVGCGITVLTGSNARDCVAGAALGGAGGALIGNMAGERAVVRRVELVAPNAIARELNSATSQFQSIQASLPALLSEQEAELNRLTMDLVAGRITQQEHDLAVLDIQQERNDLAAALELSARDARQASRNLETAARRGQTGLDWHIGTADRLASDVESTRSTFSLL